MFRIGEGGFPVLFGLLSVVYIVFWIYTLIDVVKSDFKDQNMKIIWVLIILFAQVLGPILYWVMAKDGNR
ncbi:MAG TPA: PLD nuclease N-terminal domain-containing protein [Anditalea sp.]|nr:PLD nuclease N-terminal domain-containing protein [Anditalea sp.]